MATTVRDVIRSAAAWAGGASGVWSPVTAYRSPWAPDPTGLAGVVLSDGARTAIKRGAAGGAVSIAEALRVPAVYRAAAQITTAVASIGFTAHDENGEAVDLPWLGGSPVGPASGAHMWAQCALDLLWSAATVLYADQLDADGRPLTLERVPLGRWAIETDAAGAGSITIDGMTVDQAHVLYVPGLVPMGFLDAAAEHVEHYMALVRTIGARSRNPIPMLDLHLTEEWAGSNKELETVRDSWAEARQHENGAVGISPRGIDVRPLMAGSSDDQSMLINARNAVRLDVANFTNLPANMLEGNNNASGTYQNTLQAHSEFIRLSLPLFTAPIAARLSQDDVTAPGVTVTAPLDALDDSLTDPHGNLTDREPAPPAPAMPYPQSNREDTPS